MFQVAGDNVRKCIDRSFLLHEPPKVSDARVDNHIVCLLGDTTNPACEKFLVSLTSVQPDVKMMSKINRNL